MPEVAAVVGESVGANHRHRAGVVVVELAGRGAVAAGVAEFCCRGRVDRDGELDAAR